MVHIEIRFVRGEHKMSDGDGEVLGSAVSPRNGGLIYFDDEENWCLDSYDKHDSSVSNETNFLKVAIHELGHALGLEHSNKTTALMEPRGTLTQVGEVKLDIDDIQAIQALYGAPGLPRPQVEDMEEVDIETGNKR